MKMAQRFNLAGSLKKTLSGFAVLIGMAVLGVCASHPIYIDETLAVEKTAVLYFNYNTTFFQPASYNGIPLKQKGFHIIIPAGQTTITGRMVVMAGHTTYEAKNAEFTYDFEPNKIYYIRSSVVGQRDNVKGGVVIYDVGSRDSQGELSFYEDIEFSYGIVDWPKDDHIIVEFLPFDNIMFKK
jgi:hypothetical protein